jgi:hypothetical protein
LLCSCSAALLSPAITTAAAASSLEQAMKLKINKACDLGSISVLPPR